MDIFINLFKNVHVNPVRSVKIIITQH